MADRNAFQVKSSYMEPSVVRSESNEVVMEGNFCQNFADFFGGMEGFVLNANNQ